MLEGNSRTGSLLGSQSFVCFLWSRADKGKVLVLESVFPQGPTAQHIADVSKWHRGVLACCSPWRVDIPQFRARAGSSLFLSASGAGLFDHLPLFTPRVIGEVLTGFMKQRACPVLGGNPPGQKTVPLDISSSPAAVCFLCRTRFRNAKGKSVKKSRDWILEKKERRRRQGK